MNDDAENQNILQLLDPGERIHHRARAVEGLVAITDRRLLVSDANRIALNVAIDQLRRIQFDIERQRPATLVIVPEHPSHLPQVLSIPPEQFAAAGEALAMIGQRLAEEDPG
ncbi:MAG: hypothetical protein QOF11_131 [Chloroflexota bacterium]|jgi:hypothetical protein|nr:hypothetical protein [Chloroflexota bacterium]